MRKECECRVQAKGCLLVSVGCLLYLFGVSVAECLVRVGKGTRPWHNAQAPHLPGGRPTTMQRRRR